MSAITIDTGGLDRLFDKLARFPDNMERGFARIGLKVRGTASKYAPKSPSKAQLKADAGRREKAIGRWRRMTGNFKPLGTFTANASTSYAPGALQKSITSKAARNYVEVYVPANSPAGSYAYKMHEERYKTWTHRGIGTKRKGPQAREKFITRAFEKHLQDGSIEKILTDELKKATGI